MAPLTEAGLNELDRAWKEEQHSFEIHESFIGGQTRQTELFREWRGKQAVCADISKLRPLSLSTDPQRKLTYPLPLGGEHMQMHMEFDKPWSREVDSLLPYWRAVLSESNTWGRIGTWLA